MPGLLASPETSVGPDVSASALPCASVSVKDGEVSSADPVLVTVIVYTNSPGADSTNVSTVLTILNDGTSLSAIVKFGLEPVMPS